MKKITILLSTCFLLLFQISNAQKMIETDKVPTTIEEFIAFRDKVANTPEGGAAVFAMAMVLYTQNKELGNQALTIALDLSQVEEGNVYKGYQPPSSLNFHLGNLSEKTYIARSYVQGTSPANGYSIPAGKVKFKTSRNPYSEQDNGDIKVFIQSTGADSPRPIALRKNDKGLWKAVNYNSLFVGVAYPVENVVDDL